MARHNRAAFAREDNADAKRGAPDVDLRGYAAERGLEFVDHGTPAGFRVAVPCKPELQSNVLRGVLPGGAYGVLAHEGLEMRWVNDRTDWSGPFYGVRVIAKSNMGFGKSAFSLLPVVGNLVAMETVAIVRAPCTVVGVRVPEAIAMQERLRLDRQTKASPYVAGNRIKLKDHNLPGWSAFGQPAPDPGLLARLLDGQVAELLRAHDQDGLFQVIFWCGTLLVRRNGFLRTPEELDALASAAAMLAARLREVYRPPSAPLPLASQLPQPSWQIEEQVLSAESTGFVPSSPWRTWAVETGARYRLALEDARAYHLAFPTVPVPGMATIVLRGELPRIGPGRLVVHRERQDARPGVLVEAPPGFATPTGGIAHPERGLRVESVDGMLALWSIPSYWGNAMAGDLDALFANASALLADAPTTLTG